MIENLSASQPWHGPSCDGCSRQQICGVYRKPWIDEDLASHVTLLISKRAYRQADTGYA